jgi:NitT/TauT family transport system permease protein
MAAIERSAPRSALARLAQPAVLASAAIGLAFLAAWEWLPGALGVPRFIIPPASAVGEELMFMLARENLVYHTAVTAASVVIGFALGAALGAAIGYALAISPTAEFALSPYILALQIAPKVAFAPLFVMWFGFNLVPKVLVATLIVFFPVMVNVLSAVRAIDRDQINLGRAFNATRLELFWKIEVPASMPALFAGLRIAATLAVIGVIVGELVGGSVGLGYLLAFGQGQANTPMVFGVIIMLTAIGLVAYLAVVVAEARVLHYMPKRDFASR